ncbi:sensor histidine kinase NtrY-like [Ovoidimarina sediminis]|uniref:sensor histidine kinase NtrY-like n=1 Tax=Ovoidimarina sediminis TaxID=3079856 RepID=UPI00290EC130|nr:PAS domain-containing sensor histidine kinase [Rhodophyticola sp. MJ-SS7]MDU8941946.1 PAS domain-containing sensor histidine kinase [Rhodophyticola sp. MJ-SS7]
MAGVAGRTTFDRLVRLRRVRRVQNVATFGLVLLGPLLALATFLVLGPFDQGASTLSLRLVLLADLVYVLVLAALVLGTIARMIAARRARSAGSRLHLRLTGVFATIALVPTVTVAIFAGLTINVGLEGWFSDRVRSVVGASIAAAEAYQEDHRRDLDTDARSLARFLSAAREADFFLSDSELRQLLTQGQGLIQRGLRESYVIDGTGEIRARGENSYLFDYEHPGEDRIEEARTGGTVLIEDLENHEYRALLRLEGFSDRFLYVSRDVDGRILGLLDDAEETARLYNQLESERGRMVFEFGLLYLGFAVILILAAILLGLWFAERLSRPVGRLAGAAQQVGAGDLDVHVREEQGDDEIAMLGRVFNQMTRQLKGQREALLETNRKIERRRRLFDSVLSSVTSGVIGLDADGTVSFANRSAERILHEDDILGRAPRLSVAVPEFGPLLEKLQSTRAEVAQEEIRLIRGGRQENLLVRMATRRGADGALEGYVVAFDDVTDLVSAQRMAAWGDVARRIAHEIKNPLTPIQLSAERIKRKFTAAVGDEADALAQYTDVIVRQTGDLRRIVDEFSKFARMPEPERRGEDLTRLIRDAVVLQDTGLEDISVTADLPDTPLTMEIDATMIGQALTNMIKNAGEAIESLREKGAPEGHQGRVHVTLATDDEAAVITISDNGIGLPADRSRLFEPYVTTREKGTGLGLPIVKKIIEEHGGTLALLDADPDQTGQIGAKAEIRLPLPLEAKNNGT